MIRVIASRGGGAKEYFGSGLKRADYYTDEIIGLWRGQGAALLGLSGEVTEEAFARLCDNLHPETGEKLTPRNDADRIAGWDFNFHGPKSLSLIHALFEDQRIVAAFRESAAETMREIETQISTRVRAGGENFDRWTGNLAWAEFIHQTARPVGGIPDPHLHIHSFVFNTTLDDVEGRWKAAKITEAKRDMPLHEASFHARLAKRINDLGYEIRRTRQGWEIAGVPDSLIQKFSRRTAAIEREADARGITEAKEKEKLGAKTREGKRHGLSKDELKQAWEVRLTEDEREALTKLGSSRKSQKPGPSPAEALDHAIEKLFARDSVARTNRVQAAALRHGVGSVTPEDIRAELDQRRIIQKNVNGEMLCTTHDVLAEEIALIAHVRSGKGRHAPLVNGPYRPRREFLSQEQIGAVEHLLLSNDRVMAIRGGAGTGKTTTMAEVVEAIQGRGRKVFAFAPSASASRETLRESGFETAETVSHFLHNPKLQKRARGQVIWVDEAGLLGTREMFQLMEAAGPTTRIILTGDTKQHGPVSRGDSFRTIQQFAGLRVAEITEIRRQKPEDYKSAVAALSRGDLATAFERLDRLGAIREIEEDRERYRQLAEDYLALSTRKEVPLVVSPTRRENRLATEAIRERLKESGRLKQEREFPRYRDLHWEAADKREPENYEPGLMVQFHQNAAGITRGERFWVDYLDAKGTVMVRDQNGKNRELSLETADRFQVFAPESIKLARGDRIRITKNGFSQNGKRHSNGNLREVAGFTRSGDIKLTTGAVISQRDGHFDYGYCQTSHASQSKSVRDVLIAQSSESFNLASNREQFYVSVSRGKERVRIYTDDRTALREAVGISSARTSALEVAEFDSPEIRSVMRKELSGDHWREAVAKHRARDEAKSFVDRIMTERKQAEPGKEPGKQWANYVEMRRGLKGAAGRHRAIGYPDQSKTKGKAKGRAFLKAVGLRQSVKNSMKTDKPVQATDHRQRVKARMSGQQVDFTPKKEQRKVTDTLRHAHLSSKKQPKGSPDRAKRMKKQGLDHSLTAKKPVVIKPPTPKK